MISIVIATRNRAGSLRRTLEVARQLSRPAGLEAEIVVVDNNSTDDTRAVVESVASAPGIEIRYFRETKPGTSHARNTGIREARGEILAFTDDDMILDADWLVEIERASCVHPQVAVYCGQTRPMFPELAQIAIREGDTPEMYVFPCNPGDTGASNNLVCRKAILAAVGLFDIHYGGGAILRAAEDTDLIYRCLRAGSAVRYSPEILAYHNHDRKAASKIRHVLFDYGVGIGGFYCKYILRSDIWAAKVCCWEVQCFLRLAFQKERRTAALIHLAGMGLGFALRLRVEIGRIANGLSKHVWKRCNEAA